MTFHQQVMTVAAIDLNLLMRNGIKGIILDLDNTIISEDDRYLSPHAESWIHSAKAKGWKIFILSNGHRSHRLKAWSQRLGIPALGRAKKPFPWVFHRALTYLRLTSQEVVVIGDSRHTDILGAWLSGCSSIQVASLPHPVRWWEKLFGHWLHVAYPANHTLWKPDFLWIYQTGLSEAKQDYSDTN